MEQTDLTAHVFRSKLLDKFAQIEASVLAYLLANQSKLGAAAPLGQKMTALRKYIDDGIMPAKPSKKLAALLTKLAPLAQLRSSIVHAAIEPVRGAGGELHFIFRNVAFTDAPDCYRPVVLNKAYCEAILQQTGQLANEFKQLAAAAKPPSSPPPPLPGAKAGL
jgi:hypothetical protein